MGAGSPWKLASVGPRAAPRFGGAYAQTPSRAPAGAGLVGNRRRETASWYRAFASPSSVIGSAPGAGDALLTLISLYIVYEAARLGLPRAKIIRTLANVAVEAGLGVVPLLGDLLDVVWKANLRNVAIIDEHFGMMPNR
jgi:hypothetical protein